jgi:hypothetical protein
MTSVALALVLTLAITNRIAWAQGAEDPLAQLRACTLLDRAERQDCFDRLSRAMAPATHASEGESWIISETTSPVDYSPIVSAMTSSRGSDAGSAMRIWIRCRGGRTELWLDGPVISGRDDDYAISLRINDDPPLQFPAITSASRPGVTVGGDVVRLVQSLPDKGELAVHLASRTKDSIGAVFALGGFENVRARMTATCKWPRAIAKPKT